MKKEKRKLNEQYRLWAEQLIETEPALEYIKNSNVRIAYLESDKENHRKNKIIYGQCEKVQNKNQWAIDYDFTITLYQPNLIHFDEPQIKILLFHELLHIGIDEEKGTYSTVPHDLEDFKTIIDKFGTDWMYRTFSNNLEEVE